MYSSTHKEPFDAVASDYDRQFTHTVLGQWLRQRVYAQAPLPAGARVLELNAGTGADARWLALQGCRVTATDISAEMVAEIHKKCADLPPEQRPLAQVCDMKAAPFVFKDSSAFDVVWSNFGGINCLSPEELTRLAQDLRSILHPGSTVVLVVMGRFCWGESLYFLCKGQWKNAFRRLTQKPLEAPVGVPGHVIKTWYYTPRSLQKCFSGYTTVRTFPVGFWLPPPYLEPFFSRFPRFLRLLSFLERRFSLSPMAWASDHFGVVFSPRV
jgi:ubiquinone/menaquinone biosynthesis C-methylase UbiE